MTSSGCEAFLIAHGVKPETVSCCTGCHYEWDDGYGEPMEKEGPDGKTYYVCCTVAEADISTKKTNN